MKKEKTTIIEGKAIEVKSALSREEIVKMVVNIFIETEGQHRGHGIKFRYPVEKLSTGEQLFIYRPAGLNKWNFDFKVEVLKSFNLGRGNHNEIKLDFQNKKIENPKKYGVLIEVLTALYSCTENDVDQLLIDYPDLQASFNTGAKVDVLLKVVKWMFIMEDIVYWNYKGRALLFDFIMEV